MGASMSTVLSAAGHAAQRGHLAPLNHSEEMSIFDPSLE